MADAERVFNLLLLPEHPRRGKHAPQQGGQRSAQYPHAQPINEQGVEADIDDVHDWLASMEMRLLPCARNKAAPAL